MENRSIIRKGIRVIEWLIIVLRNTIDSREVGKSAPCTHIFTDEFLPHRILILSGKAVNSDLILSFPFSFLPLSPSLPPPLSLSLSLSSIFWLTSFKRFIQDFSSIHSGTDQSISGREGVGNCLVITAFCSRWLFAFLLLFKFEPVIKQKI